VTAARREFHSWTTLFVKELARCIHLVKTGPDSLFVFPLISLAGPASVDTPRSFLVSTAASALLEPRSPISSSDFAKWLLPDLLARPALKCYVDRSDHAYSNWLDNLLAYVLFYWRSNHYNEQNIIDKLSVDYHYIQLRFLNKRLEYSFN